MNGFFRSHLLGRLFGRALSTPHYLTTETNLNLEFFFMLWSTLSNQAIAGRLIAIFLSQSLKLAFEILRQDIFFIQAR